MMSRERIYFALLFIVFGLTTAKAQNTCNTYYWYDAYNKLAEPLRRDAIHAGFNPYSLPSVSGFFGPQDTPIKNFPAQIDVYDIDNGWRYNPFKKGKNNGIYFKKNGTNDIYYDWIWSKDGIEWDWDDSIWQDSPDGRPGCSILEIYNMNFLSIPYLSTMLNDDGIGDVLKMSELYPLWLTVRFSPLNP